MCTEPLYAIRLKTEYDKKFQRFKIRTPIKVLCNVRDIGKDTSKLNYNREVYDLLMISCGQCTQCRLLRAKQRAVMSICESLEHKDNCFVTLTFGYPQTYAYYRHRGEKSLSHYLSKKKAHFHEWSLEVDTFQKFMKRLRNWYYNYQLADYLLKKGRLDLVYTKKKKKIDNGVILQPKSHIRIKKEEKAELLKDFNPKKIRCMHCGEYGGSSKKRPHHHCVLFGFDFPDKKKIYIDGNMYYVSDILKKLWPFGFHTISECNYERCAYVSRYVVKKINGLSAEPVYDGKHKEYATYSTKPVLGANYFIKNYKEIVNTQKVAVVAGKKYECSMPKSYDNILKKLDPDVYYEMKEKRVNDSKTDLDRLFKQKRSIYSKLDSNQKIVAYKLKQEVRSYEDKPEEFPVSEVLKKAKAFGLSPRLFASDFKNIAYGYLTHKTYKNHLPKSSNDDIHKKYYAFELLRKHMISRAFDVSKSDDYVMKELLHWYNVENPFKVKTISELRHYYFGDDIEARGRSLPDDESIDNGDVYIDEKGKEYIYAD